MEFLRFGSSIPGSYWGCCAVCIAQNFKVDPDEKASIELVNGDGGNPIVKGGKVQFLGKTYREIFESRLRIATFNSTDKPNHVFLAVLTSDQISYPGSVGHKWLQILKENGFEFIRTTDNSVYSGKEVISAPGEQKCSPHENYIFGLFRNIGHGAVKDPYTPPKAWTDLEQVVPEVWQGITDGEELNVVVQEKQLELWNASKPATMYTEEELVEAGVPVTLAGRRSKQPQQLKSLRKADTTTTAVSAASPFGKTDSVTSVVAEEVYDADMDDYEDDFDDYYEEDE